jgi:hypothetical protein
MENECELAHMALDVMAITELPYKTPSGRLLACDKRVPVGFGLRERIHDLNSTPFQSILAS